MADHTALTQTAGDDLLEKVLIEGDLQGINPQQRLIYYKKVCESLGLNPFTKPFAYIRLNGKLTLYALRDATDQLRSIHGVSVTECVPDTSVEGIYIVRAKVKNRDGRSDEATGAVTILGLTGDALCNAIMKAETKAKRRATLSVCGLGWLDETETDTIAAVQAGARYNTATLGANTDLDPASVPGVQSTGASRHPLGVSPDTVPPDATQGSSSETGLDPHIIEPEELSVGEVMPAVPPAMLSSGPKAPSPTYFVLPDKVVPSTGSSLTATDKLEAVMAVHKITTNEIKALARGVCKAPYGTLTPKQRDILAQYIIDNRGA